MYTPKLDYFTYGSLFEIWPEESRESELVLPAGEYALVVYMTDSTRYATNVTVKPNMEITAVVPVSEQRPYEKLVNNMEGRDYILPLGDGRHLVYDSAHEPYVYNSEGAASGTSLPFDRVDLVCYLNEHEVLLLGDEVKAFVFDIGTSDFTLFEPEGVEWSAFDFQSGRCVDGVLQFVSSEQITHIGRSFTETFDVSSLGELATSNWGIPSVAVAKDTVAVVAITRSIGDPNSPEIQDVVDATLVITDQSNGRQHRVSLGTQVNQFDVSVSPDGSRIAVCDEYLLHIYDAADGTLLYVVPSKSDAIYWRSNNALVYQGDYPGELFVADLVNRESRGITSAAAGVSVSATTAIVDGYLYIMGFSDDSDEPGHGYRVKVS
ncbi:MAG: hypothetical protein FWG47_02755 [Propionibacteriaceae bacterium]|nr:hypothetical protein [Propionibacteriaceae bacterium]